jgi:Protein of unknown function (DUF3311)
LLIVGFRGTMYTIVCDVGHTGKGCPPDEREPMTQPPVQSKSSSDSRSSVAAHPVLSAIIAVLITACIAGTLIVPIYARITPKVGDFPFFYFYLLAYMPVVAVVLWIVIQLQKRLRASGAQPASPGEVAK